MHAWLSISGGVGRSCREGLILPPAPPGSWDATNAHSPHSWSSRAARVPEHHALRLRLSPRWRCRSIAPACSSSLRGIDVDVPSIGYSLSERQETLGAVFDATGVAQSFGNSGAVDAALAGGVVVFDRSHWGRFRVTGAGRLQFLHGQSTNDFNELRPGQGCETVFVTPTARTIDLACAYVQEEGVMVIVSPGMGGPIMDRLARHIFRGDNVELQDVEGRCSVLSLIGPGSDGLLEGLGAGKGTGDASCCHRLLDFGGRPVMVAAGGGLSGKGYTLIVDEDVAGELYGGLCEAGAVPGGEEDWQRARVLDGRPEPGAELTEDYNPLEAGLYRAVSLDKGCYVGQETISKVANNNAVKQQLWGLKLSGPALPGEAISREGRRLGRLTSCVRGVDGRHWGLGYVRCREGGAQVDVEGWEVLVGDGAAEVVSIPFATRAFEPGAAGDGEGEEAGPPGEGVQDASKQEEEVAKQERLKAMQERLAAWQAQQQTQ
eukprot:evm.model.scf_1900.2 EVM.evm.TU.scf_1900.2   scf_1900:10185-11654(-)